MGIKIAEKNPNAPAEPIVLNDGDCAKANGNEIPDNWNIPMIWAMNPEASKISKDIVMLFLGNILLARRYTHTKEIQVNIDCASDWLAPQKLAYRLTEKTEARTYTINHTPAKICILLTLNWNCPETTVLIIQAHKAINENNRIHACLLKSSTSDVHGRNKIGTKNASTKML